MLKPDARGSVFLQLATGHLIRFASCNHLKVIAMASFVVKAAQGEAQAAAAHRSLECAAHGLAGDDQVETLTLPSRSAAPLEAAAAAVNQAAGSDGMAIRLQVQTTKGHRLGRVC